MSKNLNIVTYNIQHGTRAWEIIRNILAMAYKKVDVFCLQEVKKVPGKKFIIDELLWHLGPNWQAQHFNFGLCTVWNNNSVQALDFEELLLPKISNLQPYEKLFLKLHAKFERNKVEKITAPQRTALVGEFNIGGQRLRITNIHLDWHRGFKHRCSQLEYIRRHLKNKAGVDYEILCGDFNTIGFYRFVNGKLKKVHNLLGQDFVHHLHKKPTTNHFQMLDHVFVKNLALNKTEILKYSGSDHFPLLAEVKLQI